MNPTVLVLGATGRFGAAAAAAFSRAGWRVLAQRRPRPAPAAAQPDRHWIDVDPGDTAALVAACRRAEVVVHALNPAYTARAWRAEAPRLMDSAIAAARGLDALLMFPGNVYNFGSTMPGILRPDTPQRADTVKGRVRVQVEQRLARAAQQDGVRSVVLRAGDFFGEAPGTLLDRVIASGLRRGRMGLLGAPEAATPFAYLPDLAAAFVRVAQARERLPSAEVLHFGGHNLRGADWHDELTAIARAQGWLRPGRALRLSPLPWRLMRAAGVLVPEWAAMAEMRYLWTTPHTLDNTRLVSLIGPEPHTPFPEAVRRALAGLGWMDGRAGEVPASAA